MLQEQVLQLKARLADINHLRSTIALVQWDEQVTMPKKGAPRRAETLAYLSSLAHETFLDLNNDHLLDTLRGRIDELSPEDRVIVREVARDFEREVKLPTSFVRMFAQLTSEAHAAWSEARKEADFARFAPYLERIVAACREQADYLGYTDSPYNALIDQFEPGMTVRKLDELFTSLKAFLVPFLASLRTTSHQTNPSLLRGSFAMNKQIIFNTQVAEAIGFDFGAGRLDASVHPFSQSIHSHDVRITTRYAENDVIQAVLATVHEAGHAMYEQGFLSEYSGTPLAEATSYGMHESQSMIWEKPVGRGKAFWTYFYPKLQKTFPKPFATLAFEEFYRALNHVEPTYIRVEADEVTYILHIILRFEMERDLIAGTLSVDQAPDVWNEKMKTYLGITPPTDREGILQDIHWSQGAFGYFPSYALGNLYALQLFKAAEHTIPHLNNKLAEGNFNPLLTWLRKEVHQYGRTHTAQELITRVTGKPLSSEDFVTYIERKYRTIYT